MLDSLSWEQLVSWQEYSVIEPFGEGREDLRMGILAALTANVNRDPKSHPEPFKPSDFIPDFAGDAGRVSDRAKPVTTQEQWKAIKGQALAYAKSGVLGDGRPRDPGDDKAYIARVRAEKLAELHRRQAEQSQQSQGLDVEQ